MNWKTTLLLLGLALFAGLWLWKSDDWAPKLGLRPAAAPAESQSLAALAENITSEKLARIEVPSETGPSFILEKADTESGWKLPGNWPLRKLEVEELVGLL